MNRNKQYYPSKCLHQRYDHYGFKSNVYVWWHQTCLCSQNIFIQNNIICQLQEHVWQAVLFRRIFKIMVCLAQYYSELSTTLQTSAQLRRHDLFLHKCLQRWFVKQLEEDFILSALRSREDRQIQPSCYSKSIYLIIKHT